MYYVLVIWIHVWCCNPLLKSQLNDARWFADPVMWETEWLLNWPWLDCTCSVFRSKVLDILRTLRTPPGNPSLCDRFRNTLRTIKRSSSRWRISTNRLSNRFEQILWIWFVPCVWCVAVWSGTGRYGRFKIFFNLLEYFAASPPARITSFGLIFVRGVSQFGLYG